MSGRLIWNIMRVETPPDDPPWVLGNPQPRSGIRGSQSWQNANAIRRKPLHSSAPFEHGSTATNLCGSLPLAAEASRRLKPTASYEPVMKSETTVSANSLNVVDPVEQHKRDLLKQIEDNKRRKEEERQRELEMERKEEARRKLQQEIEEEERKTREKAIAAERNAARIRALQVEAETISKRSRRRDNGFSDPRDIDIGPSELEREAAASRSSTVMHRSGHFRRPPSTAKSTEDRLEWWEKKKGYADSNQQARQSPVIPALRNRMNAAGHGRQNDHDINNADDVNARAAQSHRSRSSPR
uniref:CCDC66 domain-containing protein n=1 Tax=Parascaris univalens TaxID=6257 RepID=A0A914ZL50_PARUN